MKHRKILLSLTVLLTFLAIAVIGQLRERAQDTYQAISLDTPYDIRLHGWIEEVEPKISTDVYEFATYTYEDYSLDGNHFRLTTVKMAHGDTLYFARNDVGTSENTVTLQITVRADPILKTMQLNHETRDWEEVDAHAPTDRGSFYVDSKELYYRIGQVDTFIPLGYSVRQLIETSEQLISQKIEHQTMTYQIPLKSTEETFSETWGMFSLERLINWDEELPAMLAADIEFTKNKKFALEGAYYATPNSYRPYRENSYYLNPANLDGLRSLSHITDRVSGSLFKNIATHLAYSALKNQNNSGYWPTLPLSEWLNGEYNIGYAYMDNRRNIDNTIFLLRFYQLFPDHQLLKTLKTWNDYHIKYIEKHAIEIENGGLFIPDYVAESGKSETHISLNHLAANLNYLLESYLLIENVEQLEYAEQLLLGIINTKHVWVAPNHDLYYAVSQKLEPTDSPDYITLTRDDLMETQYLLEEIYGEKNEDIQYLIDQKNIWILEFHPEKF